MFTPSAFRAAALEFLGSHPRSGMTLVITNVVPGYMTLPTSYRLRLLVEVRAILRQLEVDGLVECYHTAGGNVWSLVEAKPVGEQDSLADAL